MSQEQLADRAVLQVVEATSHDQEVLGHFGERPEETNPRCNHHILPGGVVQHDMRLEHSN